MFCWESGCGAVVGVGGRGVVLVMVGVGGFLVDFVGGYCGVLFSGVWDV